MIGETVYDGERAYVNTLYFTINFRPKTALKTKLINYRKKRSLVLN